MNIYEDNKDRHTVGESCRCEAILVEDSDGKRYVIHNLIDSFGTVSRSNLVEGISTGSIVGLRNGRAVLEECKPKTDPQN